MKYEDLLTKIFWIIFQSKDNTEVRNEEVNQLTAFEEKTNEFLKKYQIPGCIVAIANGENIVYEQTFGYQNVEEKRLIDRNTVYGIASLTKSFTCVAIMQLYERGKIDLHEPITNYLPSFSIKQKDKLPQITVHHFMTHSSGLPPLPSLDYAMVRKRNEASMIDHKEERPEGYVPVDSYKELIDYIKSLDIELLDSPGNLFSYSNDAYGLLGAIIENVSGESYEDYLEKYVFTPCGLQHTHFTIAEYGDYHNISTCYERLEQEELDIIYPVQDWWDAPAMRATGFLKSTASDMLKYSLLFLNDGTINGIKVLSPESVKQMTTPHIEMDPENNYGYGFGLVKNYFGETLIQHGGGLQSVAAKFGILKDQNLSVIVLSNLTGFPAARVMELAFNAYFNRHIDAHHLDVPSVPVPISLMEKYAGFYQSDEGMDVKLTKKDNELYFHYKGKPYPIKFIREHVFLVEIDEGYEPGEVIVDESGNAVAVSLYHRIIKKVA